jgi:hypothetical protein
VVRGAKRGQGTGEQRGPACAFSYRPFPVTLSVYSPNALYAQAACKTFSGARDFKRLF